LQQRRLSAQGFAVILSVSGQKGLLGGGNSDRHDSAAAEAQGQQYQYAGPKI
jgi:hypothetical protein